MKSNELKSKMISGMIRKFGERFCAQAVSFVVSLILARILLPEDYGIVSIVNILITIADTMISSGIPAAIIQKKDVSETQISTLFYVNIIFSIFLYFILFFTAPVVAKIYDNNLLDITIKVFALRIPVSAFQSIQVSIVSKKMEFKKFFLATIVGTVISAIVGISMALNGLGVWSLIAQYLTNTVVDTIILALVVRWRPLLKFSLKETKPLIKYGRKLMASDLLGVTCNNLGGLIIGKRYSSADLAYYDKGKQLPQLLRSNLYNTLISVLFPSMSSVCDDKERVKNITRKSIGIITIIIFPIMTGLIGACTNIILVLYSDKRIMMEPFVIIMCIETIFSVIGTIYLQSIKSLGRSDILLKTEIFKKLIFIATLIGAIFINVYAIAIVFPLSSLIDLVVNSIILKKITGYSYKDMLLDYRKPLVASFLMCIMVFLFGYFVRINIYVELMIQVLLGIVIYAFLLYVFRDINFMSGIKFLNNIFKRKKKNE